MITGIGIATLKQVHKPSQMPFAGIPLLFAFQQFIEGVLWITIPDPKQQMWRHASTVVFLILAQVVWPFWVPLSMWLLEKKKKRKKVLAILLVVGVAISVCLSVALMMFRVRAEIDGHHIQYSLGFEHFFIPFSGLIYLVATLLPFFVSTIKRMRFLGLIMFVSYLISILFFRQFLLSVWCFFGALMSCVIYLIIKEDPKDFPPEVATTTV